MSKRPRKAKVIQVHKAQKGVPRETAVLYMLVRSMFEKIEVIEKKLGIETDEVKVDQPQEGKDED